MKILLVAQLYSPYVSGSARLLQDIVEQLLGRGHDVEVLTLDLPMFGDCPAFDAKQDYKIHRLQPSKIRGTTSLNLAAKLLALSMERRYDLVLCGFASPVAMIARAVGLITRIPYAVYTHGEDVVAAREELRRKPLAWALKGAEVVMCNSSFSAGEVQWFGVPRARVKIISPGIDAAPYLAVSADRVQALRERLGVPAGARVLLTLARLQARKGHDMVIQALPAVVAAVPDVHYLIVGKGDPTGMYELASSLGVRDRMSIVDYISDADLPVLFAACEIYVMPSRLDPQTRQVEGFGIVYLEAAACGKPSVAGRQGGCADAVIDGETGLLVDTGDHADIARALLSLLEHPAESARMGDTGRFRVQQQFDKSTQLQAIETELLQCVPVKGRSGVPLGVGLGESGRQFPATDAPSPRSV